MYQEGKELCRYTNLKCRVESFYYSPQPFPCQESLCDVAFFLRQSKFLLQIIMCLTVSLIRLWIRHLSSAYSTQMALSY